MRDSYIVKARIVVDDQSSAGVRSVGQKMEALEQKSRAVGARIGFNLADGMQMGFMAIGGLSVFGGLTRAVVGLHTEIQNAEQGLAGLYSALTNTNIERSLGTARTMVQGLREDAAKGVGELTDYTTGFQQILAPSLLAGADLSQIRELNRLSVAAGFGLRGQEGMALVGFDIQQALGEGTGERTTQIVNKALLGLGVSQSQFNAMDTQKRFETLMEAFRKFGPAVELMGQSWEAQMSTLKDSLKDLVRTATQPLFNRWHQGLLRLNSYLSQNLDNLREMAAVIGNKMLGAWDTLNQQSGTYLALAGSAAALRYGAPVAMGAVAMAQGARPSLLRDGLFHGLAYGGGGGLFTSLTESLGGLRGVGAKMAFPLMLVTGAFMAVKGALSEFPEAIVMVRGALGGLMGGFSTLVNAFGTLTQRGSLLNTVGYGIIWVFDKLAKGLALVAYASAALIEGLGVVFTMLGEGGKGLWNSAMARLTGDQRYQSQANISRDIVSKALIGANDRITGMAEEAFNVLAGEAKPAELQKNMPVGRTNNNFTGPITIQVKAEINEDPRRVAVGLKEVLENLERYKLSAGRGPLPV